MVAWSPFATLAGRARKFTRYRSSPQLVFYAKGVMHLPVLMAWIRFWTLCGKSTLTSLWHLLKGDRSLDWSGRLRGNLLALKDIFRGCCDPGRIKEM
jgi:hypothetical protein